MVPSSDKSDEEVHKVWSKEESVMDIVSGLEPNHQPGWADFDYVYSVINYWSTRYYLS